MRKRVRFSDEWLIHNGYVIDLGDDGNFIHDGVGEWDGNSLTLEGEYEYEGWRFSDCELSIYPKYLDEISYADEVFEVDWKSWEVYPTRRTRVLEEGRRGALRRTAFEEFE